MSAFKVQITYHPSKYMVVPDALSWHADYWPEGEGLMSLNEEMNLHNH